MRRRGRRPRTLNVVIGNELIDLIFDMVHAMLKPIKSCVHLIESIIEV